MSSSPPPPISDAELAALPLEFQAILRRVIEHYEARIAKLEEELQSLKGARKTPLNSSLPPSTQHPHAKPAPKAPPSGKKRGGQPGHPKAERKLVPVEECDQLVTLKPPKCKGCGGNLAGVDPDPVRHQVWELPQPQPRVTEYQRHRLVCDCGEVTCATLPAGVPEHMSGPRLVAVTALFMGLFRQSKSRTALALRELFGVALSPATIVKLQNRAQESLADIHQAAIDQLPQADAVYADESPSKQGTRKAWLWGVVTATLTVFAMRLTRAGDVIQELLGPGFRGVIVTDRCGSYNHYNDRRQICWAHLKRDFQQLIDKGGEGATIGRELMKHQKVVFREWHRYCDGQISRRTMRENIRKKAWIDMWATLERGQHVPGAKGRCADLFQRFDQLWQFLDHPGVEPTNNRAERALRHFVIWRKLSFGTQSESGSRFVECMLTVIETCRQQNRNLLDFMTAAVDAKNHGEKGPSLVGGV